VYHEPSDSILLVSFSSIFDKDRHPLAGGVVGRNGEAHLNPKQRGAIESFIENELNVTPSPPNQREYDTRRTERDTCSGCSEVKQLQASLVKMTSQLKKLKSEKASLKRKIEEIEVERDSAKKQLEEERAAKKSTVSCPCVSAQASAAFSQQPQQPTVTPSSSQTHQQEQLRSTPISPTSLSMPTTPPQLQQPPPPLSETSVTRFAHPCSWPTTSALPNAWPYPSMPPPIHPFTMSYYPLYPFPSYSSTASYPGYLH
jgi:hypothetical protein